MPPSFQKNERKNIKPKRVLVQDKRVQPSKLQDTIYGWKVDNIKATVLNRLYQVSSSYELTFVFPN